MASAPVGEPRGGREPAAGSLPPVWRPGAHCDRGGAQPGGLRCRGVRPHTFGMPTPSSPPVPTELAEDLRQAQRDADAGRVVGLRPEELEAWQQTGELPASVRERFAALGCDEPRG